MKNPNESIEEYQKRGDQFLSEFDKWYKTPFIQSDGQWGKGVPIEPKEKEQTDPPDAACP